MIPKYKAYVKSEDKIFKVTNIRFSGEGPAEIMILAWILPAHAKERGRKPVYGVKTNRVQKNNFILLQCTGLKDRYGEDIYEGDIVKVTYVSGSGQKQYPVREVKWGKVGYPLYLYQDEVEVIGNIYENPELLK